MLRVARFACCVVLLMLVSAAGCDEEPARPRDRSTPASSTVTTESTATSSTTPAKSPPTTPATSDSARLSGIATRTGVTITHDGQPIDAAGLRAIGWTIDAETGSAHWSDPELGEISTTWEIPDERAVAFFDVSFWADVTAQNTATNPSMSTSVFTGGPIEVSAHSVNGQKAETQIGRLKVDVPEQPVGTTAAVSINLGFPVPVLVTYTYVYL